MCAELSVFDSPQENNSSPEPFLIQYHTPVGDAWRPVRPIYVRNGLVLHRDPDNAEVYNISHQHTGKMIVGTFDKLRTAYKFLQALDRVCDFDSIKTERPALTTHQNWLIGHILSQARRCAREGWYVGLEHWLRDYDWRTEAAARAAGGES